MNAHTCELCNHCYKSHIQITIHYDNFRKDQEYFIPKINNDSNFLEKMDQDEIVIADSSLPNH